MKGKLWTWSHIVADKCNDIRAEQQALHVSNTSRVYLGCDTKMNAATDTHRGYSGLGLMDAYGSLDSIQGCGTVHGRAELNVEAKGCEQG